MKYSKLLFFASLFAIFSHVGAMEQQVVEEVVANPATGEKPDGRYPYIYGSSESEYSQQDMYDKARASAIAKEKRRAQMDKERQTMMSGEDSSFYYPTSSDEGQYIMPSKRRTADVTEKSSLRRTIQRK